MDFQPLNSEQDTSGNSTMVLGIIMRYRPGDEDALRHFGQYFRSHYCRFGKKPRRKTNRKTGITIEYPWTYPTVWIGNNIATIADLLSIAENDANRFTVAIIFTYSALPFWRSYYDKLGRDFLVCNEHTPWISNALAVYTEASRKYFPEKFETN